MKTINALLVSMGGLGVLLAVCLALTPVAISVYGLVLAFKASILIGILAFIIQPSPFIIGLVALFADINLAQKAAEFIEKL